MSSTTVEVEPDDSVQTWKKSATIAESAESLRDNLVIDYRGSCGDEDNNAESPIEKDMKFSAVANSPEQENDCLDEGQVLPQQNHHKTTSKNSSNTQSETDATLSAEITLVKSGSKLYTKITPTHPYPSSQLPPTDAITNAQVQDNRSKRLKEDPHLKHLQLHSRLKAPLLRSTSMPVCVDDLTESEKPMEDEKSGILQHRKIYRTGSISDYTKQKLKSTILMRTSASLVRKPSITDFEMRQIQADADSSQSDDEDEEEDEGEERFKAVMSEESGGRVEEKDAALTSGDDLCRKNVLNVTSPCVISSLAEANVTLTVAMTSA